MGSLSTINHDPGWSWKDGEGECCPWLDHKPFKSRIPPVLPKDAAPDSEVALRVSSSGMERQGLWETCIETMVGQG